MSDHNPKIEENLIVFRELIPRTWWNLYQGLLQTGFEDHTALALLHSYVLGSAASRIVPDAGKGPASDKFEEE